MLMVDRSKKGAKRLKYLEEVSKEAARYSVPQQPLLGAIELAWEIQQDARLKAISFVDDQLAVMGQMAEEPDSQSTLNRLVRVYDAMLRLITSVEEGFSRAINSLGGKAYWLCGEGRWARTPIGCVVVFPGHQIRAFWVNKSLVSLVAWPRSLFPLLEFQRKAG